MRESKKEQKRSLTKTVVASLPPAPPGTRTWAWDKNVRGLGVRVTDKGEKSWYHKRWFAGKTHEVRLGEVSDLTPDEAQKAAEKRNGLMAQGIDPDVKDPKADGGKTLLELYRWYMDRPMKNGRERAERTVEEYDKLISHFLGAMGAKPAELVTREDIRALHKTVTNAKRGEPQPADAKVERGNKVNRTRSANHLIAILRAVFNAAITDGILEGPNPAVGAPKNPEKAHTTTLKDKDIPRFLQAVQEEPNEIIRDLALLCLYTTQRKNNVLNMKWDDVDFDEKVWTIAEGDAKNRTTTRIPLGRDALKVLRRRFDAKAASPYVLPGRGQSKAMEPPPGGWKPLKEPKSGWKRIITAADLRLRIHDLRHTGASRLMKQRTPIKTAMMLTGHKSVNAFLRYVHPDEEVAGEELDRAMEAFRQPEQGVTDE